MHMEATQPDGYSGVRAAADKPSPFSPQFTALPLIAAALLLMLLAFVNIFRTALVCALTFDAVVRNQ